MTDNANESGLAAYAWSMRDEGQYQFMAKKYAERKKLADEFDVKRKLADKSETIDGKPNPQYPRIRLEADMAQMRYEMAYIVEKNAMLSEQVQIMGNLFQRVDILEGAYGHMKLLAEGCRIDYTEIAKALKILKPLLKEHGNG